MAVNNGDCSMWQVATAVLSALSAMLLVLVLIGLVGIANDALSPQVCSSEAIGVSR